MAYSMNSDGTVTLDTGEVVAVSMSHEMLVNGQVAYKAVVTWEGISVEHHHTTDSLDDGIATDLLLYMLGEPIVDGKLQLAPDVAQQINIRNFITVTTAAQPDPVSLLTAAASATPFTVAEPALDQTTLATA